MANLDDLDARSRGKLPGLIGIVFTSDEPKEIRAELAIRPDLPAFRCTPRVLHPKRP